MINKIKSITIFGCKFNITYDKTHNGGSFDFRTGIIVIGIKCISDDPIYTLNVISHEIMEAILLTMGARFESSREEKMYLFSFNHQTFENAIQIHTQLMSKFYKTKTPQE